MRRETKNWDEEDKPIVDIQKQAHMSVTRRMSQRAVLEVNGFGSPDGVIEIGRSLMIKCAARPEAQVPVSRRLT